MWILCKYKYIVLNYIHILTTNSLWSHQKINIIESVENVWCLVKISSKWEKLLMNLSINNFYTLFLFLTEIAITYCKYMYIHYNRRVLSRWKWFGNPYYLKHDFTSNSSIWFALVLLITVILTMNKRYCICEFYI